MPVAAGVVAPLQRAFTRVLRPVITLLNGLTLASLYFIVAAGFTLVFGLPFVVVMSLLYRLVFARRRPAASS